MSKEAMKLALEALMRSRKAVSGDLDLAGCAYGKNDPDGHRYADAKTALVTLDNAITALREALAEQPAQYSDIVSDGGMDPRNKFDKPAQQEPVGEVGSQVVRFHMYKEIPPVGTKLYTSPPAQRPWVGLNDDELADFWFKQSLDWMEFARVIEDALRSKNT